MKQETAEKILETYPDTRGYDLAITEDEHGDIWLYDGVVQEEITGDTETQLHSRIRAWIDTATQGGEE